MSDQSGDFGAGTRVFRLDPAWPVEPGLRYRGLVWDHPTIKDGTLVTTSQIVEQRDGVVVTRSGSVYRLGRTYLSEKHVAEHAGVKRDGDPNRPLPPLHIIDLEADDASVIETHSHDRLADSGR